jgi:hypothetical protein
LPSLADGPGDRAATILRSLTSAIDLVAPGLGSVFGELIGVVIPGLKSDRLALYVTKIASRLRASEEGLAHVSRRLASLEVDGLGLFEDGAKAAIDATTERRIDAIASVVIAGLSSDSREAIDSRRVLRTLGELDEVELDLLLAFTRRALEGRRSFEDNTEAHKLMGPHNDSPAYAVWQLAFQRLVGLNLLHIGPQNSVGDSYPTTAGEHILLRAGLHPDPSKAYQANAKMASRSPRA